MRRYRHVLALLLLALAFGRFTALAKPRPELPPFPERTLFMARFDQPGDITEAPFLSEGINMADSWSGYALSVPEGGFAGWSTSAYGTSVINPTAGSIRFWYAPSWTSGQRLNPKVGTLFESVAWANNPFPLLAINVLPNGTGLAVSAGGKNPVLGVPISWQSNVWHQIGLTYSAQGTALYIDGTQVATGPGIQLSLRSQPVFGFCLGSSLNGDMQADGLYDEVTTFNTVLTPEDLGQNYRFQAPEAALGPITPEEELAQEELRQQRQSARKVQSYTLLAQPQAQTAPDYSSGPLHLTNIVFVITNFAPGASNYAQVTIAGGQTNTPYDVFRTRALLGSLTNSLWARVGRGYQGDTLTFTNEPADMAFYIAADTTDSDGDGLTDAYEALVVKTSPTQAPTIAITTPTNTAAFEAPTNLVITSLADFISPGSPATVSYYINGQLAETVSGGNPFSFTLADPQVGNYAIQAVVTDGVGATATSAVVTVSITLPDMAALKCWLKADALTMTSGTVVTNWADSSDNSNNAANPTVGYAPLLLTNQLNGLPAVKFDGTNDYLSLPSFLNGSTTGEVFIVVKPTSAGQPLWYFSSDRNQTAYSFTNITEDFGRANALTFSTGSSLTNFNLYNISTQPGSWVARLNGTIAASDANTTVSFGTTYYLGRCQRASLPVYGAQTIAEVLFYSNVLTEQQRIAVGRYLFSKYGFTSPAPSLSSLTCQGINPWQLQVSWQGTNALTYTLSRQLPAHTTQVLSANYTVTSLTDTVSAFDPITYQLTAKNYSGSTTISLVTPLILFTSPTNNDELIVGQPVTIALTPYGIGPGVPGGGSTVPAKVELYANDHLLTTFASSPWSISITDLLPDRWNIQAKTYDPTGNSRYTAVLGYNLIAPIDSDGDGVPDSVDWFPFDPTRWAAPVAGTNDFTAPIITITEP